MPSSAGNTTEALARRPAPVMMAAVAAPRYKALFVDFYGTITAGDAEAVLGVCRRIVEDFHLACTPEALSIEWGKRYFQAIDRSNDERFRTLYQCECDTLVETLTPLCGAIDPAPYAATLTDYWSAPQLHPEVHDVLAGIGLPLCCVSNADTADLRAAVRRHGLPFAEVVTSEDARCYKPAPGIFQRALEVMNVRPEQVMHVGDSRHSDVAGAQRLGIGTVWICRDGRIFDVGTAEPDHKIRSLKELHSLVR